MNKIAQPLGGNQKLQLAILVCHIGQDEEVIETLDEAPVIKADNITAHLHVDRKVPYSPP